MGKASSNKKVARAAGISGGRGYRPARPWGYFGVIALIVVLGVAGTVASRERRINQINGQGTVPPTVGTTWHEGYAVYECGKFVAAIKNAPNPTGITTKTAGVILIAPKTKSSAGKNATLGKFASSVGMTLNAAELKVPGGKLWQDGNTCEGSAGHVYVKQFAFIGDLTGQLYNGAAGQLPKIDPRDVLLQDSKLLTIAFVPSSKASSIPAPPGYVNVNLRASDSIDLHLVDHDRDAGDDGEADHYRGTRDHGEAHLYDRQVVKAVILVGGEGTRLRPLTFSTPKQMLPVGGRPMIERVLEWLAADGVDTAVLSLGYRPDAFTTAYPDGHCCGVALVYAVEDTPLDTAGAIRFAATTAGLDETFVVVNGDVLTGLDVAGLVDFHRARAAEATIALTPVEDPSAFGVVPTDTDGRVVAFVEKPPPGQAPTNLINAGTYVLERSVIDRIPAGRRVSIERETFPAIVAEGRAFALASDADWVDAGTPATYLAANLRYAAPPGDSCSIAPGAKVTASLLGRAVEVGAGAVVDASMVMDGARVGEGARVRESIVGPAGSVGAGASLDDLSVIGEGFAVGPGESLSGARLPAPR